MYHHRAGRNKQSNKKHKTSGHASKRKVDRKYNGRMPGARSGAGALSASMNPKAALAARGASSKANRFNAAKQAKARKREQLMLRRRLGGGSGPPRVVAFLPVGPSANPAMAAALLAKQSADAVADATAEQVGSPVTCWFPTERQRLTLVVPPDRDYLRCLECAKFADVVVICVSAADGVDDFVDDAGEAIVAALRAQGIPSVVGLVQGADDLPAKRKTEFRKLAARYYSTEFGADTKVAYAADENAFLRSVVNVRARPLSFGQHRAHLIAHGAEFVPEDASGGSTGTLRLFGWLRGRPLDARQLCAVPDVGVFQISRVLAANDPCPARRRRDGEPSGVPEGSDALWRTAAAAPTGEVLAEVSPEERESLLETVPEDEIEEGEQGWADSDESKAAIRELARTGGVDAAAARVVKKPKGVSDYQAAWLSDASDDGEDDEEDEDDMVAGGGAAAAAGGADGMGDDDERAYSDDDAFAGEDGGEDDVTVGMAAIAEEVERMRERRSKEAEEDIYFPNEVDTPLPGEGITARERFARYTGLQSLRTSDWDPKQMLPRDYAYLYQLPSFARAQRRALSTSEAAEAHVFALEAERVAEAKAAKKANRRAAASGEAPRGGDEADMMDAAASAGATRREPVVSLGDGYVAAGHFVCVELENVPLEALNGRPSTTPLLAGFLLHHENRTTALHFNLMRTPDYTDPIPSRTLLEFHYGMRKIPARPIFSQQSLNSNKHKFDRFMQPGRWTVASIYGPLTYLPCSCLVYLRNQDDGSLTLVATGSALPADPDRIVLKEAMLTGWPVKCKKRSAVVKYMFFDPDDIRYYKPLELHTKYGLHGHIREPLGTHGLMKCYFNKYIKNQDTVCLSLYKRVYPKFAPGTGPAGGSGRREVFTYDADEHDESGAAAGDHDEATM